MLARDTTRLNGVIDTTVFNETIDSGDAAKPTDMVLLPGQLFTALFTDPGGDGSKLSVSSYKYMVYVRHMTTDDMASSGSKDDDALSSII